MKSPENTFPRLYNFLFKIILPEEDRNDLLGDYTEIFLNLHKTEGALSAHLWILKQFTKSIPVYTIESLGGSMAMLKRNIVLAMRVLLKQKTYSLVNVFGLSIGLATFIFFAYMGGVHFFADKFHKDADEIYGVVQVLEDDNKELTRTTNVPAPIMEDLVSEFPEITSGTIFARTPRLRVKIGNDVFYEERALFADDNFLTLFTFPLLEGDKKQALEKSGSIVLSERLAKKYFGGLDVVGKSLVVNDSLNLMVTGVCRDIQRTSSIRFNALIDMQTAKRIDSDYYSYSNNRYTAFVKMQGTDAGLMKDKLQPLLAKFWDEQNAPKDLFLFPLLDFRLGGNFDGIIKSTKPAIVIMIFAFGSLLLIVACFNFINLSIARYMYRTKEVGIRKVFGAKRKQLIAQYLTESLMLSFMAVFIGVIVYEMASPFLISYIRKIFESGNVPEFSMSMFSNNYLFLYAVLAGVFTGVFSGIFPAFYITKLSPILSLKGRTGLGSLKRRGTKILIVSQFVFSLIIIIFSSQLKAQLHHWVNEADFGYNKENVLAVSLPYEGQESKNIFMEEVARNSMIEDVSSSSGMPGLWAPDATMRFDGEVKENSRSIYLYRVDYNFGKVMGMNLSSGRTFDRKYDDSKSVVINEAFVNKFNIDEPVGKHIIIDEENVEIIGVQKDYVFSDIVLDVPASAMKLEGKDCEYILARYHGSYDYPSVDREVKNLWSKFYPNLPYVSTTVKMDFEDTMEFGYLLVNMLVGMGYFAALFSYFGLLGLVAFMIARKAKEISVRKVLGASVTELITKVVRDYLKLIFIANLLALPVVYFLWQKFVQIGVMATLDISMSILLGALFITMMLAALGVYFKVSGVVKLNPSITLRDE